MFEVLVSYKTKLGNLTAIHETSQKVETREEAEHLREVLAKLPALAGATIKVKSATRPTADEAMDGFLKSMRDFPPLQPISGETP